MTEPEYSISSHPRFRWLVALWFAALLGGGLFVMPSAIHERIAGFVGMDGLIYSQQRLVIAVVAAVLGAVFGLLVAGRPRSGQALGYDAGDEWAEEAPHAPATEDVAAEPARSESRVFNLREDLAEEGIAAPHDHGAPGLAEASHEDAIGVAEPVMPGPQEGLGDLSLQALTERLARAVAAATGERAAPVGAVAATDTAQRQDALRQALDKLERAAR